MDNQSLWGPANRNQTIEIARYQIIRDLDLLVREGKFMFVADLLVHDEADVQSEGVAGIVHKITQLKRFGHSSTAPYSSQANFV